MEDFLNHLAAKNYQNRKVGLIENGSWAPMAGKKMREILDRMKNVEVLEPVVTVKSTLKAENDEAMEALQKALQV